MIMFIDTNVLLTVLLPEMNRYHAVAHLLSLAQDSRNKLFTTTLSLGSAFYMLEKRHGYKKAKQKIATIVNHIHIAPCNEAETRQALANVQVNDFEDGLQYYAALSANCTHIISYEQTGFHYASIPVLTPEDFLNQYIQQRKTK